MNKFLLMQRRLLNNNPEAEGAGGSGAEASADAAKPTETEKRSEEGGDKDKQGEDPEKAQLRKDNERLLGETMKRKQTIKELESKLSAFEGIDPEQVRNLLSKEAEAEAQRKQAEEEQLAKKGEWDRLRASIVEEHQKVLSEKDQELAAANEALAKAMAQIEGLTVGNAFSASQFITDETVITPNKARIIYGSHFEVEDGQVVAYDKPRGAGERTKLVGGDGEPLAFEQAIKKLIDADPERDSLLKPKMKSGAGSKESVGGQAKTSDKTSREKIASGLASLGIGT